MYIAIFFKKEKNMNCFFLVTYLTAIVNKNTE